MSLFLFALCLSHFARGLQGSTQNCSPVFLLKGKDLFLEIKTQKPKDLFFWKLNNTYIIVRHDPEGKTRYLFKERTEFSTEDYSVRIKNLGLNESGLYQAIESSSKDVILAEYCVTVQEHVSPVVLKVSSVSPSPESCNVSVTCSTQSSSLTSTFTCTNQTCSEDGGDPPEVVTSDGSVPLHIYLWNDSLVLCNHSNKVSWSNNTMEIKHLCLKDPDQGQNNPKNMIIACLLVVCVILVILVILDFRYFKRKRKNHEVISHSNEQNPNSDPASAYSLIGPHATPLEVLPPVQPESLYSTVNKPSSA